MNSINEWVTVSRAQAPGLLGPLGETAQCPLPEGHVLIDHILSLTGKALPGPAHLQLSRLWHLKAPCRSPQALHGQCGSVGWSVVL